MKKKIIYDEKNGYLGLRRAFIWSDKIKQIKNDSFFYFFYGDDIKSQVFIGTLKNCRIVKKKILQY